MVDLNFEEDLLYILEHMQVRLGARVRLIMKGLG